MTSTQDDDRFIKEMFTAGMNLLNKHPAVRDKLLNIFSSSRDISPDEDRELAAMAEELKADMEGSRDVSSENVSSEDQQRWLMAAVGIASTAYKHRSSIKKAYNFVSSLF